MDASSGEPLIEIICRETSREFRAGAQIHDCLRLNLSNDPSSSPTQEGTLFQRDRDENFEYEASSKQSVEIRGLASHP